MEFFKGLKIIDLSTVLAGPSVATFFAELGAKVIKIENKNLPDVTRSWKLPTEDAKKQISAYFSSINYSKEYLSLNLRENNDYIIFSKLISDADVLIMNFKKGDDQKLKVTVEDLKRLNPNLIVGTVNGFGDESDRVAYDLILQAETGFMSMNGTRDSGPIKMPVALIDVLAAHHLKEGVLAALIDRETSEEVKVRNVSVSLYDAAVSSLVNQASNYLMNDFIPQRIGSLHPNIAPYGELFQTKDGDQITFAVGSDLHFFKLCSFLKLEHLVSNEKFCSNQNRVKNREELFSLFQDKLKNLETDSVLTYMNKESVPAGKVMDLKEVLELPKNRKRVLTEEIEGVNTKRISSIAFKWH